MKHSEKYYLNFGGNRIVPESPLEVNVIRQAILADKWDLPPEQQSRRGARWPFLSLGGQAVFHPEWSPIHIIHYSVGDHLDDGFFDLKANIYNHQRLVASFLLMAALVFDSKPWFQAGWRGSSRNLWLCPWWFLEEQRANPVGLQLKVREAKGALMVGSLTAVGSEWDCLPPHMVLVDPKSIEAE